MSFCNLAASDTTRANFSAGANYAVEANVEILAFAMVETAEAMSNLDEIAATPGLDGIYVGPADLTFSLAQGRLAPAFDREEPEMIDALKKIVAACIALAVVGDVNSVSVAEHSLMLLLVTVKQALRADRSVRAGDWIWRNLLQAQELSGKCLVVNRSQLSVAPSRGLGRLSRQTHCQRPWDQPAIR